MKSNLEIEYKMLIDEEHFTRINNHFSTILAIQQKNTYYDRVTIPLKQDKMGMRIREIDGKNQFTLKVKQQEGHDEYEVFTEQNTLSALEKEPIYSILKELNIQGPFQEIGHLTTYRKEIAFQHGVLCIDKNEYYGIIDYELEFELYPHALSTEGLKEFEGFLKTFQLNFIPNKRSKIQRCIEAKEEKND